MIEDTLAPVTVVVELRAAPESVEQTRAELLAVAEARGGEPGSTGINVLRDPDDPCHFLVTETFESAVAFENHISDPSTSAFAARMRQLLAAPPVRGIWHQTAQAAQTAQTEREPA